MKNIIDKLDSTMLTAVVVSVVIGMLIEAYTSSGHIVPLVGLGIFTIGLLTVLRIYLKIRKELEISIEMGDDGL